MSFSVSKKRKELDEQEKSRSSRIRALLEKEPEAGKFFGEGKKYIPPQEESGKFTPQYEFDRESVINKAILGNKKDVDSRDYRKKRDLNPHGQAAAAGLTEEDVDDKETKAALRKIRLYRERNK
jgi:hypothetical protein